VQANPATYRTHTKALSDLQPLIDKYLEYKRVNDELSQLREVAASGDAELKALAEEEIPGLETRLASSDEELRVLLIPKDPNDDRNIVLEIRGGELVCIAEPGCWFAYHYWLDEARRPDFAPTVDIHRKPGYDPAELFVDPRLRFPKLRVATTLAKKRLGFRYLMDVIPTDPSLVKGTHGRLYGDDDAGPVFLCSDRRPARDRVAATDVKQLLLSLL
jgi:hypothetical protein